MKQLLSFLMLAAIIVSCNQPAPEQKSEPAENSKTEVKGMFIHISEGYDDAHRVLMPMKMAVMMAKDKDVLVYLDIDAVKLVVNSSEDLNLEGFESFRTYLGQLNEMNVGVYACPTCLKVAGYEPGDLLEGVKVASKEKFFNFTDGRFISLDY